MTGNTASTCAQPSQCCPANKMWAYRIEQSRFSNNRGDTGGPVGASPDKMNWKVMTLDGLVRQGSYSNNLEWDNVWWERGAIVRPPSSSNILTMPSNLTDTLIDFPSRKFWHLPPTNTSLQDYRLLTPGDLSSFSGVQGKPLTGSLLPHKLRWLSHV